MINSPEARLKNSLAHLDSKNNMWVGSRVGYKALHAWVKRNMVKPELCQICNIKPPYDLANVTGFYNRDFVNWIYLCRSCHMRSDGRIYNLKHQGPKIQIPPEDEGY